MSLMDLILAGHSARSTRLQMPKEDDIQTAWFYPITNPYTNVDVLPRDGTNWRHSKLKCKGCRQMDGCIGE